MRLIERQSLTVLPFPKSLGFSIRLAISFDPGQALLYGLNLFLPIIVSRFRKRGKTFQIVVQLSEMDRFLLSQDDLLECIERNSPIFEEAKGIL